MAESKKAPLLEENLKKALTELLLLFLLSKKECYIGELADGIREHSHGALSIVFPYGAIYRLLQGGYILEKEKRNAPDGRRRQYFQITERGAVYLQRQLEIYHRFTAAVSNILEEGRLEA